ncbi:MAG: valine--tRNA ligase [Candidatus Heimdallarchaeota archaeon]
MPKRQPRIREKRWDPTFELELIDTWTHEPHYRFAPATNQEIYVIDTPPVYPSGDWHIGASAAYTMIDMVARFERMRGKAVLFPFCLDRNGINIELLTERKHQKALHEFNRAEFIHLCRETMDSYSTDIVALSRRIGLSADYSSASYYETDSSEYRAFSQACFLDLWKKGLVYEDQRPIFFCPECRTTIAEAEIYHEERQMDFVYLKFSVLHTAEELHIATTRPELLCACQAILVNPDDARYSHLHHKTAKLPYYDKEVPIVPHHGARADFGTGAMMICSYGDLTDVQLFRELQLKPIVVIDELGRMAAAAGPWQGMTPDAARSAITQALHDQGLVDRTESGSHKVPICERSRTPIELISLPEWYLKQIDFAKKDIYSLMAEMQFLPEKNKQILIDWAKAITIDWPISRRRYYHTEIPIWYCTSCRKPCTPESGKYYRPWCENPPFKKCPHCEGTDFEGETRVFDTWIDSSVTNLYMTRFLTDSPFFAKAFPCSLRPQGRDIVRTWLFSTMLRSFYHTGKPAFDKVWIHGMGLDEHGQAMSKSKGNVLRPEETLDEIGADAFRLWIASETNVGEDFRISKSRMLGAQKFLTKLWNIARFISMFEPIDFPPEGLSPTDEWIIVELSQLITTSQPSYEEYNFFGPATKARSFIREVFASNYLELVKFRAYEDDPSAVFTLHYALKTLLQFLAPIIPFSTDLMYRKIYGETVHSLPFPNIEIDPIWKSGDSTTEDLMTFNSSIWKEKRERGLPLNAEISGVEIPRQLSPFAADLRALHRLV